MKLIQTKKANINYLAKVVDITNYFPHPNPEVTRMKCAKVDGYTICVGIDEEIGKYVYFPVSCTINPNLLSHCNLYRHTEKNSNIEKAGFFEDNGRVKAIKLKGLPSEGFLLPFETFQDFLLSTVNKSIEEDCVGTEFDAVEHNGKEFWICKKYVVKNKIAISQDKNAKKLRRYNKIIDTQFRLHYNTVLIRKNPFFIQPEDNIHISSKIHGTSGISAYVKCRFKRSWYDKFWVKLTNLFRKEKLDSEWTEKYDYVYSSRTVIKNAHYNPNVTDGYYGCDVWVEADKIIRPVLWKGMTMYYEIVGFLPNGGFVQKNYDYGCVSPKEGEEYTHEKHFKVRVYRITLTNVDGRVHEFSPLEVQQFCKNNGLTPVTQLYYGKAKDLYPELILENHWHEDFIDHLADDKRFYMEMNSPDCVNKVPHEGIVIKVDNMQSAAVKLKTFKFLGKEQEQLDAGESNIEDEA